MLPITRSPSGQGRTLRQLLPLLPKSWPPCFKDLVLIFWSSKFLLPYERKAAKLGLLWFSWKIFEQLKSDTKQLEVPTSGKINEEQCFSPSSLCRTGAELRKTTNMRWRSMRVARLRHSSFEQQLPWLLLQGGDMGDGQIPQFCGNSHCWRIAPLLHPENPAFGNPLSSPLLLTHDCLSDNVMSMTAMSLSTLGQLYLNFTCYLPMTFTLEDICFWQPSCVKTDSNLHQQIISK